MSTPNILLNVNGIEVIYNHVILVLKGVSLQVPEGKVVALLGGNGAGKTTTLRAVSNLLRGERGEVTKGSIELRGERIEALSTSEMVNRGVIQVMEGRHCFAHLSIEDNLMTGAYTRQDGKAAVAATLEKVYAYFPRLKTRRTSQAAYTSGGEQQMCAIGRALMANPKMVLLDEPSMGLAPQIVEEVFEIVKDLNTKEQVTFLLAEQNTNMALRYADYGYILENGRIVMDGAAVDLAQQRGREGVLPRGGGRRPQELPRREELSPPQEVAGVNGDASDDAGGNFFSPPQFKPAEALLQLQRTLRALGGLTERGLKFEWKGRPAVTLAVDAAQLQVQLARRPAISPVWESRTLKNGADVRKFGDDVRQRIARWRDADD